VAAVPSGADALALLSNPPGGRRPDTLILDIEMPAQDGYMMVCLLFAEPANPSLCRDRHVAPMLRD
jgi:CheY-like chemotaxis protein